MEEAIKLSAAKAAAQYGGEHFVTMIDPEGHRIMITTGETIAKYKPIDKLRYIRDVLPYIEKHLAEELEPERIASRYFVSTSQLYRDFYACTGHSVKEYICKRRISNACEKNRGRFCIWSIYSLEIMPNMA